MKRRLGVDDVRQRLDLERQRRQRRFRVAARVGRHDRDRLTGEDGLADEQLLPGREAELRVRAEHGPHTRKAARRVDIESADASVRHG